MKIRDFKTEAKQQLKGQWFAAALVTLVFAAIYVVIPMIIEMKLSGGYDNWMNTTSNENGQSASTFIITLVLLPLSVGYSWLFLSLIRTGERVKISGLFQAFSEISMYLKLLGTYLLMMIYVILWSLLLIIPGIIKAFAYSQTYFVYKDNPKMGINAAITESRKLMHGYKWKFFVLQLSFIGWVILGLITVGIGFIWIYPYMSATYASFYNALVEKKKGAEPIVIDEVGKDE
ncbi:DUF975 family protein [Fictibacillus barbaricus]|uniref:Membrane protein n=1 Tax=Fictibacillus barbaricus TaxID=182136 RepID=A0ABU1U208_9BACL|nr:DUF975 family protein [Fictibacillus barbaricus]MDR7073445.1 putative membrane protein [Fictibacillus barbaricus]